MALADVVRRLTTYSTLDASGYKKGAQDIAQANAQVVASGLKVVETTENVGRKQSSTTDSFNKWLATLDKTTAAEIRRERQLDRLNREMEAGAGDATRYALAQQRIAEQYAKATGTVQQAERAQGNLNRVWGTSTQLLGALGVTLGAFGLVQFGRAVVDVSVEFQRLHASLETVTGSTDAADSAFDSIRDFAADTPFSVQQVTEAFIRLKSLGLDASMDSLESYGNTASSMGKDVMQFIEAVADASTFEFERLKEFGIRAKQQGDEIAFTFQGTTTRVGKNAEEIEGYLKGIGDVQFAGAMDRQMKTMGGQLSNLGDAWDNFLSKIGEAGAADGIGAVVAAVTELLGSETGIKEIGAAFRGIGEAVAWTVEQIAELMRMIGRLVDGPQSIKDLQAKIAELTPYASDPIGASALKKYQDRLAAITDELRLDREGGSPAAGGVAKTITDLGTATDKAGKKTQDYIAKLQRQLEALDETAVQVAVYNNLLAGGVDVSGLMVTATGDLVGSYTREAEAIAETTRAISDKTAAMAAEKEAAAVAAKVRADAVKAAQEYRDEVQGIAEDISADLVEKIFEGGEGGFDALIGGVKDWGRRLALEIAQQKFIIPITAEIVGLVPGLFGVSGSGGTAGGGLGFISSAFNDVAEWAGGILGFTSGGTTPSVGLDGRLTGGGVTATGPSYFSSIGGLSGMLGGAGMGFGIGSLMQGLGIGNQQGMGSSIGGGIGGLLGTFATPVLGPLGPVLGGVLGSLVGGLFGPKPSNNTAGLQIDFGTGKSMRWDDKPSEENVTLTNAIGQELTNLNTLIEGLTGQTANATLSWWLGDRDGVHLAQWGEPGQKLRGADFGGKDEGAIEALTLEASKWLVESLTGVDAAMKAAMLRSLDLRDSMEEVGKDFQVLDLLFGEQEETLSDTEAAIKSLNDQFDDAAKRAGELGLAIADVEAKREEALQTMRDSFLDAVSDDILALEDPMQAALNSLQETYEQAIKDAEALGVDTVLLERRYGLQRNAIIEQYTQASIDSLQALLDSITYGALSGASPVDVLGSTRAAFDAAVMAAQAGDTDALAKVAGLGSDYLSASRDYNASGAGYYADRDRVEAIVRDLIGADPTAPQAEVTALSREQVKQSMQSNGFLREIRDSLREMAESDRTMRNWIARQEAA